MPCDSIQRNRIDLPTMNTQLRNAALVAMGATILFQNEWTTSFRYEGQTYNITNGVLVGPDASVADVLKRSYSAEVIKATAKRAGWGIKQVGKFQYQVTRR